MTSKTAGSVADGLAFDLDRHRRIGFRLDAAGGAVVDVLDLHEGAGTQRRQAEQLLQQRPMPLTMTTSRRPSSRRARGAERMPPPE